MNENFDITARELFDSLLSKSFERRSSFEEKEPSVYYAPPLDGIETQEIPLLEEEDRDILMHRDAHFAKSFPIMLQHYEDEDQNAVLDVETDRIRNLMDLEERLQQNLAPYLLQGPDAEKVAQSIRLYKALREQAENKKMPIICAISDLILGEDEPEVAAKKAALLGKQIIPYLMQLIQTQVLYDPLFPGYGLAPMKACLALGILQAKEAIKLLFGMIGSENFDTESACLEALRRIGMPARHFILEQLASRPITKNNERAAIAASALESDHDLALAIIEQLEDKDVQKITSLATYLVLACSKIPQELQDRYKKLIPLMPDSIAQEMRLVLK
jgi:hypothetical protein